MVEIRKGVCVCVYVCALACAWMTPGADCWLITDVRWRVWLCLEPPENTTSHTGTTTLSVGFILQRICNPHLINLIWTVNSTLSAPGVVFFSASILQVWIYCSCVPDGTHCLLSTNRSISIDLVWQPMVSLGWWEYGYPLSAIAFMCCLF